MRRYCPECGQAVPTPSDYSLRAHAAELFEQITSLDGKLARTLWTLVRRPGVLTADHLAGRRRQYLRPLQLFFLINVLLFVVAPQMPLFSYSLANYAQYAPPSPALVRSLVARETPVGNAAAVIAYARAFDQRVEAQRKSLILLFAPALALVLLLIFHRRAAGTAGAAVARAPGRYGEHLMFALHVLAFVWLVLVGWGAMAAAFAGQALTGAAAIAVLAILSLLLLAIPAYVLQASRLVYSLSWPRALALTVAIVAAFVSLLVAYRALLFFTTYYTL